MLGQDAEDGQEWALSRDRPSPDAEMRRGGRDGGDGWILAATVTMRERPAAPSGPSSKGPRPSGGEAA